MPKRTAQIMMVLAALLAIVAWPMCLATVVESPPQAAPEASLSQQLERAVSKATLGAWWGAALVVKDGRTLLATGCGFEDEDLVPITADSLFDIGSASKQFTAATLLRLQAHGVLSLDDVVAKFFPQSGGSAKPITVRQLLTHTSGLSDANGAIQRLDFADRDEAVRLAMNSRTIAGPSERFEYCNGGYVVLAAVIEVATGRKFEDVVRDEIFKPAGMTNTGFLDGAGLDAARATLRAVGGRGAPPRRISLFASPTGEPWAWGLRGAGGVITTLNDWAHWDAALRSDAVLDAASRAILFQPHKEFYAMGWRVNTTADGTRRISHGGSTRGYMCEIVHYPEDGVGIAVFTNESGEPWKIVQALERELFPQRAERTRAVLHLNGRAMNQHRLAKFTAPIAWEAQPELHSHQAMGEFAIRLTLKDLKEKAMVAEIQLSRGSARGLLEALESLNLPPNQEGPVASQSAATIQLGLRRHAAGDDGMATVEGEQVRVVMMPQYRSTDEQGVQQVDPRPTLVITDAATSMWPLIVTMDPPAASLLGAALRTALRPP